MTVSVSDMLFGAVERQLSRVAGINIIERMIGKESDENSEVAVTGNRGEASVFMKFRRGCRINKKDGARVWQIILSPDEQARIEQRIASGKACCLALVCVEKELEDYRKVHVVFISHDQLAKLRVDAGGILPAQLSVSAIEGKQFRVKNPRSDEIKVPKNGLVKWAESIS